MAIKAPDSATTRARRWYRPIAFALTLVIGLWAAWLLVELARSPFGRDWAFGSGDLLGYLDGARRFLATGSPYLPAQVDGPWALGPHSFIHPPSALPLFVPFLWLPSVLWWAIPILGTAWLVVNTRPAPWTWPLIALCLVWPRSAGALIAGNSDLWAMLFVALGLRFGWPFTMLIFKPTFALLAVLGIRHVQVWRAGVVAAIAMLPLLPLWLDYVSVIRNAGLDFSYSLLNLPLVVLPVFAWAGRTRTAQTSAT